MHKEVSCLWRIFRELFRADLRPAKINSLNVLVQAIFNNTVACRAQAFLFVSVSDLLGYDSSRSEETLSQVLWETQRIDDLVGHK